LETIISSQDNRAFYAAYIQSFLLRIEWGIATSQLPIYVYEQGASPLEVSLVFTVFAGLMIFSLPLGGYCSDYLGKRKPFIVLGMVGLCPIFLMMSTQTQVTTLILLRGSTALCVGAIVPPTWALISDLASHETVGEKMGFLTSAQMAGFGVGPIVGGVIADTFGFAFLWMFVAVVCLAGGLIFLVFGSDSPIRSAETQKPILFRTSWKRMPLRNLMPAMVFSVFLLGIAVLGPNRNIYLVTELGMSKTMFGAIELIGTFSSMMLQPILGSFSDKHGRKPVMILAAVSLSAGLVMLYLARDFLQTIPSAILMANYASFQMVASAYVSDTTKPEERGGSLGFLNALGSASRSLGAILGGLLIMATSIRTTILLSVAFPTISTIIIVLILKEPKREITVNTA
jgi:MFS family permease